MSIAKLINRPAKLVRRTVSEDDFDQKATTSEMDIFCWVSARSRKEQEDGGETSDAVFNAYILPADTEIRTGDAIDQDGVRYEAEGAGWNARNPRTGRLSHVEATVKRVTGTGEA